MMKKILKIGVGLVIVSFIFFAGLSIGFASGALASARPSDHFSHRIRERMAVEEGIDRFVEDMSDFEADMGEFGVIAEEFDHEMGEGAVVIERHGRFGHDITVIPPVPRIPPIPDVPAAPFVPYHRGPILFRIIGGLTKMFFAVVFILIGVWFIVRRNQQPVEKSPKT